MFLLTRVWLVMLCFLDICSLKDSRMDMPFMTGRFFPKDKFVVLSGTHLFPWWIAIEWTCLSWLLGFSLVNNINSPLTTWWKPVLCHLKVIKWCFLCTACVSSSSSPSPSPPSSEDRDTDPFLLTNRFERGYYNKCREQIKRKRKKT